MGRLRLWKVEVVDENKGHILLQIARSAIGHKLGLTELFCPQETWLREKKATFVTLRIEDTLRGCIGTLEAFRPLDEDLRSNAVSAAFSDPRFQPMIKDEFLRILIEASILSKLEPLEFVDENDALAKLRPFQDGVVFQFRQNRSTFLPQVWESLPDPREFMAHLKKKAGVSEYFWGEGIEIFCYSLVKWSEKHGDG